jgi:O2-independent ubiquinone biosynthesis protein UbiU
MTNRSLELVCPAGTPAALEAAVDAGAHAVYVGFANETNARNFPGLNFDAAELTAGIAYAHRRGARVFVAINTYARAGALKVWQQAVDSVAELGADAAIVADIGVAAYAATVHPELRLHLSVQAGASSAAAIRYYHEAFNIHRVVLPRILTVAEIAALNAAIPCETEVFVFGGLCVMAEGRCALSSYCTGQSPNMNGVCSPASHVSYRQDAGDMVSRLGSFTINRFVDSETAAYPTLCKGRFKIAGEAGYVFEDPVSLDAMKILPELAAAGVTGLKIEGRQRSRAYVRHVVSRFRNALDAVAAGLPVADDELLALTEGGTRTTGAYRKNWQ